MECKIDAVLIDTSAYHKNQCDFDGVTNSIIPMLLQLLAANDIVLLTHPILESEIKKHIKESELVTRIGNLQTSLKKYNRQLQMIGISVEELIEKLNELGMEKKLRGCFDSFYQNAIAVPYVDAQEVFSDYFNARPPFSLTGDKKSEFPDAFILKGIKEYCKRNPDSTILVISDDSDWVRTLDQHTRILVKSSLEEAIVLLWEQLDDKTDLYQMLISKLDFEIRSEVENAALCEAFCIEGIDIAEDVDVDSISVVNIDEEIVPLNVTSHSALLQITTVLSADGYADFLDENRSVWDREDHCYYFCAYTHLDFRNAIATVDCEISIEFSDDGSLSDIKLASVKLLNKRDISLNLDEAEVEEKDTTDYGKDDFLAEQAEAAEEYYKH